MSAWRSLPIAGSAYPPIAIHSAPLEGCWGKTEITGNLPAVFERPIEYFARQNRGEILADATDPVQCLNRSVGRIVLRLERLLALGFHLADHLQGHHEAASQTVHLGAQEGWYRAAVSGPHFRHVLFP